MEQGNLVLVLPLALTKHCATIEILFITIFVVFLRRYVMCNHCCEPVLCMVTCPVGHYWRMA